MLHKAFSNYLIHEYIIFRQIAPTNIISTSLLVIRTGNCKTTLCWENYGVFNWQEISNQGRICRFGNWNTLQKYTLVVLIPKKKKKTMIVTKYHVDKKKNYVTHPKWPGCTIINYLRWSIEKISQERNCLENLMRNNFNIAMPQASQKIKD